MFSTLTLAELVRMGLITQDQIQAAVDAYFAGFVGDAFQIAEDHVLDLNAAVAGYEPAQSALTGPNASVDFKRAMVRGAILRARPTKS